LTSFSNTDDVRIEARFTAAMATFSSKVYVDMDLAGLGGLSLVVEKADNLNRSLRNAVIAMKPRDMPELLVRRSRTVRVLSLALLRALQGFCGVLGCR
jgi:hypothetical protein